MNENKNYNTSATIVVFPKAINGFVDFNPTKKIQMHNDCIDFSVLIYIEQKELKKEDFKLVILKEDIVNNDFNIYVLEDLTIGEDDNGLLTNIYKNVQYNRLDRTHSMVKKTYTFSYENAKLLGEGIYFIALISSDTSNGIEVINSWQLDVY